MQRISKATIFVLVLLLLQGCGPKTFEVRNSALHVEPFSADETDTNGKSLAFIEQDSAGQEQFSRGRLAINLQLNGLPVDHVAYLENNVIKELNAKGVDVDSDSNSKSSLNIEKFFIRNHRTNGYTPFITFANFKGVLVHNGQNHDITAFVKRGKVPVWSFDEVIEPTFNEPLALVSKEVAAKINRIMFGRQISDTQVLQLVSEIEANAEDKKTYLKVYELAFGNNNSALESLIKFTQYDEEYIRLAAISSLGILQAEDQVNYLWSLFETSKTWQDRAMALKALGDINNAASKQKLEQARSMISTEKQRSIDWFTEILNLY